MKFNLKPIRKDQVIAKSCEFLNWTEQNAPSIETYGGLGLIFGGTIWACKRTLNMPGILEELAVNVEGIREDYADDKLSEREYAKALTKAYGRWALKVLKNYAGSAAMVVLGYSLVIKGHNDNLTRIASLTTLLRESADRESRLEQAILDNYGPEVLEKLKNGEPLEEIEGEEEEPEEAGKEELADFDFIWRSGMGDFCPHDNAMNWRIARENILYYNKIRKMYGRYAPINDIYRTFGAFDKVRKVYEDAMVGFPNLFSEDGNRELDIEIQEMPFNVEPDRKKQSAPDLKIIFKEKPISCLEWNKSAGFCQD